ncbi:MAG: STAS-like domain-containing protein [Elusimicrobia bacterium]|nr:STAS-like domain-containing protein [Elusimicrobiota bacterium]
MSDPITVRVFDIVGGQLGVSADDGQRVFNKIAPLLREGKKVSLSFEQIETLISSFLNAAIGQLYGEFPEENIRELLSVRDMDDEDIVMLKRVIENAKVYFKDPKRFDKAWKEEVGNDEE